MPIRDAWRRVRHKKDPASSGEVGNEPLTATGSPGATQVPANPSGLKTSGTEPSSFLTKTFPWRSAHNVKDHVADAQATPKQQQQQEKKKRQWLKPTTKRPVHPSEEPLDETALRHQELLANFQMNFGRAARSAGAHGSRRKSSIGGWSWRSSMSGISPGTSRNPSFAVGAGDDGETTTATGKLTGSSATLIIRA